MDGVHLISWDLIAAPFDSPPVPGIYWSEDLLPTVDYSMFHSFLPKFPEGNVVTAKCGEEYDVELM